jgi:hypothetical protein
MDMGTRLMIENLSHIRTLLSLSLCFLSSETAAKEAARAMCAKLQAERSSGAKAYVTPTRSMTHTHIMLMNIRCRVPEAGALPLACIDMV